jgi:hypothetical protein
VYTAAELAFEVGGLKLKKLKIWGDKNLIFKGL